MKRARSLRFPSWSEFKRIAAHLFKSKRPFRLTGPGWVFILYTIGVGAGAINTGNNLLYLIFGVFLGVILASGLLSDLSLWGLSAECDFPDAADAERANLFFVRIRNEKSWLPSISVNVEVRGRLRGEEIRLRGHVPFISAGGLETAHLSFRPARRGWFEIENVYFLTRYPFGLLRKWWVYRWDDDRRARRGVFVYPAPASLSASDAARLTREADAVRPSRHKGEGAGLYGLRDYRDTDNPRRIHWKASAKRLRPGESSGWLVREMEREEREDVILLWPAPAALSATSAEEREDAVRFAAAMVQIVEKAGGRPLFYIADDADGGLWAARSDRPADAWEFLSLFDPGASDLSAVRSRLSERPSSVAGGRPVVDLWTAYRRWKAGAAS